MLGTVSLLESRGSASEMADSEEIAAARELRCEAANGEEFSTIILTWLSFCLLTSCVSSSLSESEARVEKSDEAAAAK